MSRTVDGLDEFQAQFASCSHELGIPTPSLYGMKLILRLGQHDCPRCLRRERDYWKARARGVEGSLAAIREAVHKEAPDMEYIRRVAGPAPRRNGVLESIEVRPTPEAP